MDKGAYFMKFLTKAIHVGSAPDPSTGAIMPPIFMSSTFVLKNPGETIAGYDYTRAGNPNFTALEEILASLEGGQHATVFSSGLGALSGLIAATLKSGDHVVAVEGTYGGTYRLFRKVFEQFGVGFEAISPKNSEELENILSKKPRWFLVETPTNPLLEIFDIEAFSSAAKKHGVMIVVDNTFATPYFQNPLKLGADVVWHSTTKYVGGHSDIIGGVMITNNADLKQKLNFSRKSMGVNPSPFDVWLAIRGVKTLGLRMEQHQRNAMAIAEFLAKHPLVNKVYYPGLKTHPRHEIARKQMTGFSGMVSVDFKLSFDEMKKFFSKLKLFALAESLGGVESLVCHPVTMTHAAIPAEERNRIGITEGLARFSVGVEDTVDLIEDLEKALK
jgi:cystathionine beta-lyase/cystathionine gamma-synthase